MFAVNRSTKWGARRVRSVALVAVLGLTGSLAATMAVGASPAKGGGSRPAVATPVSDAAPMVDPLEDEDESDLAADGPAEADGAMAPMIDPVEDEHEAALAG